MTRMRLRIVGICHGGCPSWNRTPAPIATAISTPSNKITVAVRHVSRWNSGCAIALFARLVGRGPVIRVVAVGRADRRRGGTVEHDANDALASECVGRALQVLVADLVRRDDH